MGKALEKLREFDEAISCFKKALRRDKNNFDAHYRLGLIYIRNDQKNEGIESLKRALALDPDDIDVLLKLGEVYLRDERTLNEAEQYLKMALEKNDYLPDAHFALGRVYEKKGYDDFAIEQYKIGMKMKMSNKVKLIGLFNMGCLFERKKDIKQAIYQFK